MIISNPENPSETFDLCAPGKRGRRSKWITEHPQYKGRQENKGYKKSNRETIKSVSNGKEEWNLISTEDLKLAALRRILAKENSNYTDPQDFILYCFDYLNPQSYGGLIEKRVREKNNMKKIDTKLEEGDAMSSNPNDQYPKKEVKASISAQGQFRVVQIRPNNKMDSYLLYFFEITSGAAVIRHMFEVPKRELENFDGIGSAHGKEENAIEWALTIKIGSPNWKLLNKNYKTSQYNF